jgi:hypothetical protein
MADLESVHECSDLLARLFDQMVEQQRAKVLRIASGINPRMTEDDIMDSPSFPELTSHPQFQFEDGLLAGLVAASVAVNRELNTLAREVADKP